MDRIEYVDIFRGFAILLMIFFHFVNRFGKVNVYTDFPYFLDSIGTFAFTPPPVLFLAVAGMSSYLLVTRRKNQGRSVRYTLKNIVVKYGRYVLISLPFTWFVFDLQTYLQWNEALQGIGMTIIFLSFIYLARDLDLWESLGLITLFGFIQWQRNVLLQAGSTVPVPAVLDPAVGFTYNMFLGGWFSITNLLPFALAGLMTIKLLHEKEAPQRVLSIGLGLTGVSLALKALGIGSFGFYDRSILLAFYGSGTSMIIFYVIHRLWKSTDWESGWKTLSKFGRMAFPVYIWHFLLIVKPAQMIGLENSVSHLGAYPIAFVLTSVCVISAVKYFDYTR